MVIKRPVLYELFKKELQTKKVIYIFGPTGWGKTTAVLDWLDTEVKNYTYLSLNQGDYTEAIAGSLGDIVVIDDIQNANDLQSEELILTTMNNHVNGHFILIGRCALPAFLKPYQLISQLASFNYDSLKLNYSMISELLLSYGLTEPTLPVKIERATMGYPMAVFFLTKWLSKGEPMNTQTFERMKLDLFDCYDELVFKCWDSDLQKFMLHMASFETFTEQMAGMVTGKKHVISIIDKALSGGSYLVLQPPNTYSIHPVFRNYLLYKQHSMCSAEFMRTTYHNAALYYEIEDDIEYALYYYSLCDDTDKLAELLIFNSNQHPGNGHYYETEHYYRALPKKIILASSDLMCGMCMLCSLCCKIEESEYWFTQLEQYSKQLNKQDHNFGIVQGKLVYLKIALPHRGSKQIARILLDVVKAYNLGAFQLQEFSVTSNLPSVINGGKDFCEWVRNDRKLYFLMKKPVELILGRYGFGLADIALAESLFEKSTSDNLTEIMMLVNAGQNAADFKGTLEVKFVAVAIMSRVMLMQNNLHSAYALLDNIENRVEIAKMSGIIFNIKALRIKFTLMEGKIGEVNLWLQNDAPDEIKQFRILDRYCYLAKVRCYLAIEKYTDAIALLGRLLDYFKNYDRTYGQLEAGILLAITQYCMKQDGWQKTLNDTLERCEYYGFIRFIAEEGVALLPLLQKASLTVSDDYSGRLLDETKRYALLYPLYQKSRQLITETLTETEKMVLRLICKGLSNKEIAKLMDITLRTVKFHTGNLYSKMNVKSRAQAIRIATELP
jgi:LuxR family maltose regulon positive regulatory protein